MDATIVALLAYGLAYYLVAARVLQSATQLMSSSNMAVQLRFAFFVAQLGIALWWILQFIKI